MRRLLIAAAVAAGLAAPGTASAATTFTVTKTPDTLDGSCTPSDCSLREALTAANDLSGADVVVLPAGTYPLTIPDPGDDVGGGDLDIQDSTTLTGAGARTTTIQAGGGDRVMDTGSNITVEISGVTMTGGGGVAQGGGMFSGATLTLRDVAFVGNTTSIPTTTSSRQGAGLFTNAPATLERVLIAGNTATAIAGDSFAPQGGGLFINDEATLSNVTISGNTIDGTGGGSFAPQGGGLFVNDAATLGNVTIAGNSAVDGDAQGGGIFYNDDTIVRRSIVAGNRSGGVPDECYVNDPGIVSEGVNLATNAADCAFTAPADLSADPLLAPLANTGGPSDTHALGAGSPALDRAPFADCPVTDQRGFARAGAGSACDLGAHEQGAGSPAPPVVPPSPAPVVPISAPAPAPAPKPKKLVASAVFTLPSVKKCVSRRAFRIRLRQPSGVKLKEARVFVNSKRVKVVSGKRLTAPVDLRGLPKGRFSVKVTATATDGRKVSETRRYRTCAVKKR